MDTKTLAVLEFPRILSRRADFCDFSASSELALTLLLTPGGFIDEISCCITDSGDVADNVCPKLYDLRR